jgi:uncharacterized protein (TIGR02246 family)
MRQAAGISAIVVGLALLIGCHKESAVSPTSDLHDFAERYTAAWCSQDPASVAAFFSPEGSLTVNDGEAAVGRDAISDVARGFMSAFPDMQVLLDDVVIREDAVEYHWTLIGTNTGPAGTGHRVHISGYEEWTLGSDGLIVRSLGHFDEAEYRRQLEHTTPTPPDEP